LAPKLREKVLRALRAEMEKWLAQEGGHPVRGDMHAPRLCLFWKMAHINKE
jgi:hypothetical protein